MNSVTHHNRQKTGSASLCIRLAVVLLIGAVIALAAMPAQSFAAPKKDGKVRITNISKDMVIGIGKQVKVKYKATGVYKGKPVRFSTSDARIARVSSDGILEGVSKGSVRITVSMKKKPSVKHTLRIFIGNRIENIRLSGYVYLQPGRASMLTAEIMPSDAVRKKLTWKSSNPKVVKVSDSGRIKALKKGKATIKARARDGSGTVGTVKVTVFKLKKNDATWIAHRGLWNETVTENTAKAFRLAGKNGFGGCECDVWETAHTTGENADGMTADSFDLVINHDASFSRTWGYDKFVKDMTAEEIRTTPELSGVCFLQEYLDICHQYGMTPVIELKDPEMSQEAIEKIADMVYETGAGTYEASPQETAANDPAAVDTGGRSFLEQTFFVSFYEDKPMRIKNYIHDKYGVIPITSRIIGNKEYTGTMRELQEAKANGFTGVSLKKELLSKGYSDYCHDNGLQLHVWTYKDALSCYEILYQQVVQKKYGIASFTTNGKPFQ